MEVITENLPIAWMAFGAVLILLEVLLMPGIGFFFAGMAAVSLGLLLTFDLFMYVSVTMQVSLFFMFTCFWAAVLWIPIQKFKSRKAVNSYENITGELAVVWEEDLQIGIPGKVTWSGTILNARLDPNSKLERVEKGQYVRITGTAGSTLIVEPKENDKINKVG